MIIRFCCYSHHFGYVTTLKHTGDSLADAKGIHVTWMLAPYIKYRHLVDISLGINPPQVTQKDDSVTLKVMKHTFKSSRGFIFLCKCKCQVWRDSLYRRFFVGRFKLFFVVHIITNSQVNHYRFKLSQHGTKSLKWLKTTEKTFIYRTFLDQKISIIQVHYEERYENMRYFANEGN